MYSNASLNVLHFRPLFADNGIMHAKLYLIRIKTFHWNLLWKILAHNDTEGRLCVTQTNQVKQIQYIRGLSTPKM